MAYLMHKPALVHGFIQVFSLPLLGEGQDGGWRWQNASYCFFVMACMLAARVGRIRIRIRIRVRVRVRGGPHPSLSLAGEGAMRARVWPAQVRPKPAANARPWAG